MCAELGIEPVVTTTAQDTKDTPQCCNATDMADLIEVRSLPHYLPQSIVPSRSHGACARPSLGANFAVGRRHALHAAVDFAPVREASFEVICEPARRLLFGVCA